MSKSTFGFIVFCLVCGLGLSGCAKTGSGTASGTASKGTTAFFPVVGG